MRFVARFITVTCVIMTAVNTCSTGTAQESQQPPQKERNAPDDVTVLRDVVFGTGGGRDLTMHIVLPNEKPDGPMPVYVWVHGGGWQGGTKDGGIRQVLPLVREGFVGATIGYRLTGEAPFPAQIEDCKCAIRYLRAHAEKYNLDPKRFSVGGSSAGGHLVALLGTSGGVKELEGTGGWADQSSAVQAVVDLFGPTDFKAFVTTVGYEAHNKDGSPESKLLGGGEVLRNEAGIKRVNPITYVDKADPPFLIVHGSDDRTVPLNQSQAMHEALKSVGVESTLHIIEGAGHGGPDFAKPDIQNMQREFLLKHMKHGNQTRTADDGIAWQSLFDGDSLDGWKQLNGTATYEVVDGTIVGTTVEGSWNSFLCTERQYADFELEFEVRVDDRLNSGVQIRSKTRDKTVGKGPNLAAGRVIGPQVEIEASKSEGAEAGYIYDEATGKGWLTPEERLKPHKHFKDRKWNHFRILARGPRIQTWINDVAIEDLSDEQAFREYPQGFIGLQVHRIKPGAGPYSVAWRNIRIKEPIDLGLGFRDPFDAQANSDAEPVLWPSPNWPVAEPAQMGLDSGLLERAEQYALSAGGSGMIIHRGHVVRRWGDQQLRYDIKSATKSFGATMLGVALKDGKLELHAPARRYHPTLGVPPEGNGKTGWLDDVSLFHLATQTAGFEKSGGYEKILFKPGTQWHYSDGGPNWLAECITLQYRQDLEDLMFERVFAPLGITREDVRWRNNQYRDHEIDGIPRREFGAGIHCNVEALSRLGYLYLHNGRWKDQQILTEDFVRMASRPLEALVGLPEWTPEAHGNASDHYSLLWWNNADGTLGDIPRDAYWAWGLYDSLIVVIPSLDAVVVRGGAGGKTLPRKQGEDHYAVLKPFLAPIVAAVNQQADRQSAKTASPRENPPYPMSDVITKVQWSPQEDIIRLAKGSDNWPITWADDGHLYSAYGDGWGFNPMVEKKLSLGLVRVEGTPPDIKGINVRSSSAERIGQGENGEKASGMLMVDGVLYMFVRNAGNSQLGWSADHGKTWTWADWKFTTSYGCPTFLNFGQNYAEARDDFVYLYSHDSDSAYEPADRMVMARADKSKLTSRDAYEFFEKLDADGKPVWTRDVARRGSVFDHVANCYRCGVTYNSGLERYLWCQILPQSNHSQGMRFQGGFGIYEAPEPWGPWKTVYFTRDWDVGPGETSSIPTKWMSHDGQSVHLVFSGDDYFSVRQAKLSVAQSTTSRASSGAEP